MLVDGGFANKDDIDTVSAPDKGCTVYAPVSKPKDAHRDRFEPLPEDSEAVVLWYVLAHNLMRAYHLRLAAA